MPTYEYVCRDCGHRLEVVQKFTDDPLQVCERCQGRLRKVFNAAGIIFRGSGYYVTDTRTAATKAGAGGNGASSDGASDSSDSSNSPAKAPGDTGSGTSTSSGSESGT